MLEPFVITLKMAVIVTCANLVLALPIAKKICQLRKISAVIVESFLNLPAVLPPVVLGFYLLLLFSPSSYLGYFFNEYLGMQFVFTFKGIVIAGIIFSFPLTLSHVRAGLSLVNPVYERSASVLGLSPMMTFWKVTIPLCYPSIIAATMTTFAHMMGAFGVILMVGGGIPGETKVASIAIYDSVESLNYSQAHQLSLMLVGISFIVLIAVNILSYKGRVK